MTLELKHFYSLFDYVEVLQWEERFRIVIVARGWIFGINLIVEADEKELLDCLSNIFQ